MSSNFIKALPQRLEEIKCFGTSRVRYEVDVEKYNALIGDATRAARLTAARDNVVEAAEEWAKTRGTGLMDDHFANCNRLQSAIDELERIERGGG